MCVSLQGAFPARLKCVFIVSSPLWFRAPFAVLRLFVREKLRERVCVCRLLFYMCVLKLSVCSVCNCVPSDQVCTVKAHELANHIPVSSLPEHLGGTSQYSHVAWIQSCVNKHTHANPGEMFTQDTHDCVGSLLCSYYLDPNNASAGAMLTTAQTSIGSNTNPQLVLASQLATTNSDRKSVV